MAQVALKRAGGIAYREAGPSQVSDGSPVLCIHGWPQSSYMWRHLLPNVTAPYIVVATASLGGAILVEASLSFLGLGVPQVTATADSAAARDFYYKRTGRYVPVITDGGISIIDLAVQTQGMPTIVPPARSRSRRPEHATKR